MAFSYSDKNFSVNGNLCFVHIYTDTTGAKSYSIPPTIVDRMAHDNFKVVFVSKDKDDVNHNMGICTVNNGLITFTNSRDIAYLNFSFPIDSNK